ncbi:MAG: 1-(5-phosphoribosyl)-5-[(5-phosphoribosylamino)methylideneamino] imidazole-4-carboxamide isomerase [Acidimicrobiales bacterium]|nr:1-(5-phosphoribosyl)-5-[(5-phosphoribosylamino)methylideneamino] imidazole-4-carboxamide isomerase [Acidimicrobiales bacterium]
MELYPAIDIRGGGAVRLAQGDFDRQSDYGDPVALARRFAAAGAPWLHVVDLDAARAGQPANRPTVLAIAAAVDIPVQSGGGVRSEADVDELLNGGVARVVLGTAALDDPQLVMAMAGMHPGRVAVGIDYRQDGGGVTEVAVRGWEEGSGRTVDEVLAQLAGAGVAAVIVTNIERDGMLTGPDLDGLRGVLAMTEIPVIASGGVGAAGDVEALARLEVASGPSRAGNGSGGRRLSGVITGRALVDGRMSVEEGVAACALSG